jgi:phosphatidylserine decarboxylase
MIGGFLISSIQLSYNPGNVRKGDEQGYFAFGGSTLVWLSEKGAVFYDDDINENSQKEIETYVKLGTQIGRSYI